MSITYSGQYVTFENIDSIDVWCQIDSITWASSIALEIGTASLFVHNHSDAFSEKYINPEGGSLVKIYDPVLGIWNGIVSDVEFVDDGVRLECVDLSVITQIRLVGKKFYNVTNAGFIAKQATNDAVAYLPNRAINPGIFTLSAPELSDIQLDMETMRDVLVSLTEQTGQEWEIDQDGNINWVPRVGKFIDSILVQGTDIIDVSWGVSVTDRISEVIVENSDGFQQRLVAHENLSGNFWPAQRIITMGGESQAKALSIALSEVEESRFAHPVIQCKVHKKFWDSLREADTIRLLLTRVNFTGDFPLVRILSRTWNSNSTEYLDLTMEKLTDPVTEDVGEFTQAGSTRILPKLQYPTSTRIHPLRRSIREDKVQVVRITEVQRDSGRGGSGGLQSHNHERLTGTHIDGDWKFLTVGRFDRGAGFAGDIWASNVTGHFGQLRVAGEPKTAVIEHPESPNGYIVLTCREGEVTRFEMSMYLEYGEENMIKEDRDRRVINRLPSYFKDLLEDHITVSMPENIYNKNGLMVGTQVMVVGIVDNNSYAGSYQLKEPFTLL